jgi:hypothetical protein
MKATRGDWHALWSQASVSNCESECRGMPLPLTKEVEDCQAHAAHCARQAKGAACPNVREDFLRLEQNWLQLARSYEVAQQIVTAGTNGSAHRSGPNNAV